MGRKVTSEYSEKSGIIKRHRLTKAVSVKRSHFYSFTMEALHFLRSIWAKTPLSIVLFLVLVFIEGGGYISMIGPLTVPDPDLHLQGAYAVATGQSFNETVMVTGHDERNGNEDGRRILLTGDNRYFEMQGFHNVGIEDIGVTQLRKDALYDTQTAGLNRSEHFDKTIKSRSNQYLFFAFLPQGLGLKMGMTLGLHPSGAVKCARLANLCCYAMLLVISMLLLPKFRAFFAVFGLLPLPVFCASSLMADGVLIGFSTMFIALSFRLFLSNKPLRNWQVALLIGAATIEALLKYAYAPLFILPLFARKALTKKQKIGYSVSVVSLVLAVAVLWQSTRSFVSRPLLYQSNLSYMKTHFLALVCQIVTDIFVQTFDLIKNDSQSILSLFLLLFTLVWMKNSGVTEEIDLKSRKNFCFGVVFAAFASLGLCYLMIFLSWSYPGHLRTDGLQTRYLYPLIPLLVAVRFWPRESSQFGKRIDMVIS